ncbi:Glutathione S-transferase 1 [Orchesella cincta]|uniref:glutathione transferase n=1 Tax=Orchesella cincta TaxID=48709 RepID=A0A1D2NAX7_ORCCI|nr:Glutathione S-transferase 1 [Orchesella cincta]
MSAPKYKLSYFDGMWIAEPARYLLSYVKEDFEDVRFNQEQWDAMDKKDFPYGKVPVLEDTENGLKLGQSLAIVRYLAKKFKLVGETDAEAAKCDEYADVFKDLLQEIYPLWSADEEKKVEIKAAFMEKAVPRYFSVIESDLKNSKGDYLIGKSLTWADIISAHFTELFQIFLTIDVLANYPTMKAHQQRVFKLDGIREWRAKRPATPY